MCILEKFTLLVPFWQWRKYTNVMIYKHMGWFACNVGTKVFNMCLIRWSNECSLLAPQAQDSRAPHMVQAPPLTSRSEDKYCHSITVTWSSCTMKGKSDKYHWSFSFVVLFMAIGFKYVLMFHSTILQLCCGPVPPGEEAIQELLVSHAVPRNIRWGYQSWTRETQQVYEGRESCGLQSKLLFFRDLKFQVKEGREFKLIFSGNLNFRYCKRGNPIIFSGI